MKQRILEYLEGTPDNVYDTNKEITWMWDDNATCFGYFPITLDNDYIFMTGSTTHFMIAAQAAKKLMGKAISHIREEYKDWINKCCYEKSYCLGRFWNFNHEGYSNIMAFWYMPSSRMVKKIVEDLKIDPTKFILVTEESQKDSLENITVAEYITMNASGDEGDDERNEKFRIDPKVIDIIKRYNETDKSWQYQKEREGWKTLAQRNAMLYQENRQRVDEYFQGDPDTIREYDSVTRDWVREWNYRDPNVISFGYFQTSIDGDKEFIYETDKCHYDIAGELGNKVVGKAIGCEDITKEEVDKVKSAIYHSAAYKGRIFLDPEVVTTWYQLYPSKLAELLNMMGGVEKYADFTYVCESLEKNVAQYLSLEYPPDSLYEHDEYKMKDNIVKWLDPKITDIIRRYNTPSSKLADKTSKLGNMTIAQYNSLIHQEEKEPKQTIKENNKDMKNNKYQEEFSNYITIMSEALQKDDYKAYEYVKQMLDEAIEDHKHEQELMNEMNTTNFGVLNHIFESELPTLIKTNKKAVKNVINTIKEDKNLKSQFSFYNVLKEKYNGKVADTAKSKEVLETLAKIVCENIDPKTVKASNRKLRKVMIESGVKPSDFVDEDSMKLYENGNVILTTKRNSDNTIELIESYNEVCKWMDAHKEDKKTGKDADELIREFEEKLKENLTESEISFVQQITDWRSPIAEQRKEKLFNKFKNECLEKINDMLKEDAENVELKGLSDQLSEMKFDKNNIVKDIAKLLEIRDILMDD